MTITSPPADDTADSPAWDPIALEVLRSRLEAIAEDAASTIERTGVSPVITESHDFGVTLLDAHGNLIAGAGFVAVHWVGSTRAVKATIERYGADIEPGDVFLANDPFDGGGLHANDVVVERPIFVDGERVAWVALSGHMLDMGGMVMGSFAPAATDCFQEAIRFPPVRLFKRGEELTDVWAIFRANVRMATLIEMDLRGLVAGSFVAQEKLVELATTMGTAEFADGVEALQRLSEREFRRRIEALDDGTYRVVTWAEWDDEIYRLPCTLTVKGDTLHFDFDGASDQAPHFINSQPYIMKSSMVMLLQPVIAADLPYTQGLVEPIELTCPPSSIVNATPPAPINMGHVNVATTAAEAMVQCVRLAMWASETQLAGSELVCGWGGSASMAVTSWSGLHRDQTMAGWSMIDGVGVGAGGTIDHDGFDQAGHPVGLESPPATADVEVLESWYPMLITERRVRPGVNGAGAHRAGGGAQVKLRPYGTEQLVGQMLGIREWLPLDGAAGGFPGARTVFQIHRADGSIDRVSNKAADVVVREGETFEFRCASGGGVGDPLDRGVEAVADDVLDGVIVPAEAAEVYGVVVDEDGVVDDDATATCRSALLGERLRRAAAPERSCEGHAGLDSAEGPTLPLYPGVVQRGNVAYAEASGAPLAVAPDHWTDGCAVLEEPLPGVGPTIVHRAYLDPVTGRSLYVESVPEGEPRAFEVRPDRWGR